MESIERIGAAMRLGKPDRVPLMCQPSWGFVLKQLPGLDPPPLGNVELEDAVRRIGHRAFIKGNIDPVNLLMNGTPKEVYEDAARRLEIGMRAKGFILSTACSIAPGTPPENLEVLYQVVEKYGYY